MEEIDYKELLKKYMEHIWNIEGSPYTGQDLNNPESKVIFTEEEVKILNEMSDSL